MGLSLSNTQLPRSLTYMVALVLTMSSLASMNAFLHCISGCSTTSNMSWKKAQKISLHSSRPKQMLKDSKNSSEDGRE